MQTLLYFIGLIVATALWGYIFYKQEYHPQPWRIMVQSFCFGLFAILPIFAYQWLYENLFPFLASHELLRQILQHSIVSGLVAYSFSIVFLALVLFGFSFILSEVLTRLKSETLKNSYQALKEEPLNFAAVGIIIALAIIAQSTMQQWLHAPIAAGVVGSLAILVIIEEYVKHLIVRLIDDKKIHQVEDAITLSIMVGLAFAFIETVIYTVQSGDPSLITYRVFLSIPIHIVASGIFGYYYGLAHFARPITTCLNKGRCAALIHRTFTLKKQTLYREEKMLEGLLLATLFHTVCNILFELNLAFIVVPIVVMGLWFIFILYDEKISHIHWQKGVRGILPKNV